MALKYKNINGIIQRKSYLLLIDKFKNRFKCCCILCLSRRKFQKLQLHKALLYTFTKLCIYRNLTNLLMFINIIDNTHICVGSKHFKLQKLNIFSTLFNYNNMVLFQETPFSLAGIYISFWKCADLFVSLWIFIHGNPS
jgi:hypothetical protein